MPDAPQSTPPLMPQEPIPVMPPSPEKTKQPKKPFFDLTTPEGKKKFWIFVGGGIVLLLLVLGIVAVVLGSNKGETNTPAPTSSPTPTPTPVPVTQASNLDGLVVATELALRHPLAIMIENTPGVRPQAGLSDASLVYEAITEGGITRFMAVYGHTLPEKAGPVRSARPVFIDFAEEFQPNSAYYAHVGGSEEALGKIKGDGVYDLNQFAIGNKAFQRFPKAGVATEHTMFTFPNKLYEVAKSLGYKTESSFRTWKFKDDADATTRPETQTITVPFSSAAYDVKYVYDKASNTYKRYIAGAAHTDANNNKHISPKNVIVQYVKYETAANSKKGHQNVKVIGEGTAKIFRDGKVVEAKWKKPSSPGRTIYTEAATGDEIPFVRGQTFIELVKTDANVTVQ